MAKKILILVTGNTYPEFVEQRGDFHDLIIRGMGILRDKAICVDSRRGEKLPLLTDLSGVIITGSHSMVTFHENWSEEIAAWLKDVVNKDLPILGICYGHQLLAYALGGEVIDNPRGREYGTVRIRLTSMAKDDQLFQSIPVLFPAQTGHTQTVSRLPPGAIRLAQSDLDDCQAFRYGNYTWGVQFHPEFDPWITRQYILRNREILLAEGQQPDQLLSEVRDTPDSAKLLKQFIQISHSINP